MPDKKLILNYLQKHLSAGRLKHILGVTETAINLAIKYGADPEKAELAGLLHDCAKEWKKEALLKEAQAHNLIWHEIDVLNPHLLHARVGALIATEEFGIKDTEILNAITQHTLGKPDMSLLEKILFVADIIEPNRLPAWSEPVKTALEKNGLNSAIIVSIQATLQAIINKKALIHPLTITTYNFYLNL